MSVLVVGQSLSSNVCDFPLTVFQLYQVSVICCNDGIDFFWSFLKFFVCFSPFFFFPFFFSFFLLFFFFLFFKFYLGEG